MGNTEDAEEASLKRTVELDKNSTRDIDAMVLGDPNPEEVGKEYVLEVYYKVWGDLDSQIYIAMPQTFRLGAFLESLSLRQDRAVYLLQKLCADVAADRTWYNRGRLATNICVADLEAQGLQNFPERWENMRATLNQVGWVDVAVKEIQAALLDATFTKNK